MVAFLVMKYEEVAASSNSWKSCEIEKKWGKAFAVVSVLE